MDQDPNTEPPVNPHAGDRALPVAPMRTVAPPREAAAGKEPSIETTPADEPPVSHTTYPSAMDVHHHAHAPHGKNKWKEYVFQFFMLFLAVFCGFLAEYQLEHTIEHQREKKYMKGLLDNLAADTAMLNATLDQAGLLTRGLDSLQQYLYAETVFQNTGLIYRQYGTYLRMVTLRFNDQSITQLRNSGNMRLIRNKEITEKISGYWAQMNIVLSIADRVAGRVDYSQEAAYRIFNRKFMIQPTGAANAAGSEYAVAPEAVFMTNDKNDLVAFANSLNRLSGTIGTYYLSNIQHQKRLGKELMTLIKEEYNY